MAENINCKQCDTPMRLQLIKAIAGEEGVLKIAITDFPALVCEREHRHFIAHDFPMRLLEQVAGKNKTGLPAGKKKGLIFKKFHCGKCGDLLAEENHSKPFGIEVKLADAPQMRVELSVPVYKCAGCGQEQLRDSDEIEGLTPAALAHAFQGAGIKPEA